MSRGASATSQQSVQDAKKRLQKFIKTLDTVPTQILNEEAPILRSEIIAEVPYDTGKLESSVRVSVARDKRRPGLNASASAISKSGYNYAGIQHENDEFRHTKPGAKAHFISDPLNRCIDRIQEKMRIRIKL